MGKYVHTLCFCLLLENAFALLYCINDIFTHSVVNVQPFPSVASWGSGYFPPEISWAKGDPLSTHELPSSNCKRSQSTFISYAEFLSDIGQSDFLDYIWFSARTAMTHRLVVIWLSYMKWKNSDLCWFWGTDRA